MSEPLELTPLDDLETRVKDMTDEELEAYYREIRQRRKRTPEKAPRKAKASAPKSKQKFTPEVQAQLDELMKGVFND